MVSRRAFVAATSTALSAFAPAPVYPFVGTSPGAAGPTSDDGRAMLTAVSVIVATEQVVRTVWRPPELFPPNAPIAYYVGRGGDRRFPDEHVVWLNPDHPELVSPRISRLTDEVPLLTEFLIASVDLGIAIKGAPSLGLERIPTGQRRDAAGALADKIAVITKFSPFEAVDDVEFARRAFAFVVLRQMTPQIGGVAPFEDAAKVPPGEVVIYAGRDVDKRAPAGWGVIYARSEIAGILRDQTGYEAWVRAFVLATADRQPPTSDVKRAYDAAAAQDAVASGDRWAARRAFAARYVAQVAALFGK